MSSKKMIAVRDPQGFRPLCMGHLDNGDIVFASESCALDIMGAHFDRDIEPGEIVVVSNNEIVSVCLLPPQATKAAKVRGKTSKNFLVFIKNPLYITMVIGLERK